jgi:antitoxin YefM
MLEADNQFGVTGLRPSPLPHHPACGFDSLRSPFGQPMAGWQQLGGSVKKRACQTHVITYVHIMKTISATLARSDLYRVIDSALQDHEPVQITGKRGNAVLVSEADWRAIQETLFLVSMPGMRKSIRDGMAVPIADCSKEVDL